MSDLKHGFDLTLIVSTFSIISETTEGVDSDSEKDVKVS